MSFSVLLKCVVSFSEFSHFPVRTYVLKEAVTVGASFKSRVFPSTLINYLNMWKE